MLQGGRWWPPCFLAERELTVSTLRARAKQKTAHRGVNQYIAERNHAASEKPKAVFVGCRLCPEHGDSVPHHLLDHHPYPVSICRRVFRFLGRDVGGSRHRVRLQGNPSPKPVCRRRPSDSDLRQLRALFALSLALPVYPGGDGGIDSARYIGNGAVRSA